MEKADWIYGIWFIPGHQSDFLGTMFRAEGKWRLEYRFRYYSQDSTDPHDGKDEKHWAGFSTRNDSDEEKARMIAHITQELTPMIECRFGTVHDFVALDCKPDDPKIFFEVGSRPWAHIKRLPVDQVSQD